MDVRYWSDKVKKRWGGGDVRAEVNYGPRLCAELPVRKRRL